MKIGITKALSLLAGASVIALGTAGTAQAAHHGVELVKVKGTVDHGGKFVRKFQTKANQPTTYYYSYYFVAYVPVKTKTIVTGWALMDWSACTEITAGKMKMTSAKKTTYGAWSTGIYSQYTSYCGIDIKYSSAFYTSKKKASGNADSGTADWVGKYAKGVYYNINNIMEVYIE